jgi:tetratricopeptide (TPR) repeat protein
MPLYRTALGPYGRAITTNSADAQAYFDQGMQFVFAFTLGDAARAFREAQKLDPSCAMCFWGEAYAWGSYLNGDMDADDAPRAHAAITRALALAPTRTTPVERALIEAMAVRYEPIHDRGRREKLDSAYAEAMAQLYQRFPADLDLGTLYAESLMLLEPRRGTWSDDKPAVRRIHQTLEEVLARDIKHPGACHLYIHATESTSRPGRAEACADYLGLSIPGASHINHMPSHTYNRVGRWGDAVRANIQAWHSDLKAEIGEGFAIYPSHNLHMLLFAASMDGQGAVAIQAAKDYARISDGGSALHAMTLLRFGRFDEILPLTDTPRQPVLQGFWAFARGYAHLRLNAPDSARLYLNRVDSLARRPDSVAFRGHPARQLLGVTGGILRGEIERHGRRLDQAVAALERAVALEDSLRYDEPEPLNFSARDWLGAALLEANRPADAERVYRAALEDHPNNGWSLVGLEQALRAQGRSDDAARTRQAFERAWARADTWLRASRF